MPVSNLLVTASAEATLHNFDDEVVVRLTLPEVETGVWLLLARVVITNLDGDDQDASARLTTDDGATEFDMVGDIRLGGVSSGGRGAPISLQGVFRPRHQPEPIVDLRCSTYHGLAAWASLFALLVDDVLNQ